MGSAYLVDEALGTAQTAGSGANCETVEITKYGGYSPFNSDECDVDEQFKDDFYSTHYVVNQCISAEIAVPVPSAGDLEIESVHSAVLRCDAESVSFEFYRECGDCQCAKEVFVYRHFTDSDECWKVECN